MTTNLHKLNWLKLNTQDIVSKVNTDGVRYLELFLKDYTEAFNKTVNPSCNNCISNYLKEYKEKFQIMANESEYKLLKKREGIQLEFGSKVHVTNANITNEYALKLLKRFIITHGNDAWEFLFEKYPENGGSQVEESEESLDDASLSLAELRIKYPEISARSKEKFIEKLEE